MHHLINWTQFITFITAIFAISNPFGGVAIFINLTANKTPAERHRTAIETTLAILLTMLIFVWIGEYVLRFFGISLAAFQGAGGFVVFLLGLSMLHSERSGITNTREELVDAKVKDSIAVVPMAIPIIAGPGTIATIIVASHQFTTTIDKVYLSAGCLGVTMIIGSLLYFSRYISKALGVSGLKIVVRLTGLVLMAIAVQVMATGIKQLLM